MRYWLRDRHGASRAVAYLMLPAAPFVFVTGVVLAPPRPVADLIAISANCLALMVIGTLCRVRPHLMPDMLWLFTPFVTATLVTGMNLVTHDASTGAQLFYLWPILYAASFLSRRVVYLSLAYTFAGEAVVVFSLLEPGVALADMGSMILAITLTAIVVLAQRERADRLREVLETQALADALTGLANRRSFDDELTDAGAWAARQDGCLALLTVDVDYFKRINDTWGHAIGDQALQEVAGALRAVAGPGDVAARLGGDEFVLLMRRDRAGALHAAEELRAAVAAADTLPGGPPSLSIGVAVLPDHADTVEGLVAASDRALYDAKTNGRGQVAVAYDSPSGRHDVDRNRPDRSCTDSGRSDSGRSDSGRSDSGRSDSGRLDREAAGVIAESVGRS